MKKTLSIALLLAATAVLGLTGCTPDTFTVTGNLYQRAADARDADIYLGSTELQTMNQSINAAGADYVMWSIEATNHGTSVPIDWEISVTSDQTQAPRLFESGSGKTDVKMDLKDTGAFGVIVDATSGLRNKDGVALQLWKEQRSAWVSGGGSITPTDGNTLGWEVTPIGAGGVTATPDQQTYQPGQVVELTAVANSGYVFDHWTVNGVLGVTDPHASVRMDSKVVLAKAFFRTTGGTNPGADTTPPVITLNGSATVNLTVGASWSDPGATATDAVDGRVNVSVSGAVNTAAVGNYVLTYSASDSSGNTNTANRTVFVSTGTGTVDGPKMTYALLSSGVVRQTFYQGGWSTLQQCWIGFPVGKTWADVEQMGTMFMHNNDPLLYVETAPSDGANKISELHAGNFAANWAARSVPYVKLKGSSTRYFGNTGVITGYGPSGVMTRSDGDNWDLVLAL